MPFYNFSGIKNIEHNPLGFCFFAVSWMMDTHKFCTPFTNLPLKHSLKYFSCWERKLFAYGWIVSRFIQRVFLVFLFFLRLQLQRINDNDWVQSRIYFTVTTTIYIVRIWLPRFALTSTQPSVVCLPTYIQMYSRVYILCLHFLYFFFNSSSFVAELTW